MPWAMTKIGWGGLVETPKVGAIVAKRCRAVHSRESTEGKSKQALPLGVSPVGFFDVEQSPRWIGQCVAARFANCVVVQHHRVQIVGHNDSLASES